MVVWKPLAETLIINAPPITLELSMIKIQEQYCRRMRKLENEDTKVSSLPQEESNPILVNIILNVSTDLHELIKKQN